MKEIDPWTQRLINLGAQVDKNMAAASIDKCNCMIRCGTTQLPAIRKGKKFFTPEGRLIEKPDSFEDMRPHLIKRLMDERGETYIGHMVEP